MRTKTKKIFQNKFFLKSIKVFLVCLVIGGGGFYVNSEVEAKTYEVTASCAVNSQNACCGCRGVGLDISFPSPIAPNCSAGFTEFHYADRIDPTAIPVPADYNSTTSDPWVSSTNLSKTNTRLLVGATDTLRLYDDDSNVIASASKTNANNHTTMNCILFSCSYRICSEIDVCIPTCSTSIGGCLLTDPDPGNTSKTGNECCGVGDCYECSSGIWNGSACATSPPPPLPDFIKGGIIPCGRYTNNPATSWNDMAPCNFCHLIMMVNNLINFLLMIMASIAVLALIVTGLLFVTSSGDPERKSQAKTAFKYVIIGFIIILISWIIIDFFLIAFGYLDPLGGEWNVICD